MYFFIFILFEIEFPINNCVAVLRRLIWVCTVCLCPFYGPLSLYGLSKAGNEYAGHTAIHRDGETLL